jgi:hypothetical protein
MATMPSRSFIIGSFAVKLYGSRAYRKPHSCIAGGRGALRIPSSEHRRSTRGSSCWVLSGKQSLQRAPNFAGNRWQERSDTPSPLSMRDCIPFSGVLRCALQAGRPRRPLRRGQTYLWQVTATLRGGSTVVDSGPPSPEALLRIIPSNLATLRKAPRARRG